jgi:hypothetical protein
MIRRALVALALLGACVPAAVAAFSPPFTALAKAGPRHGSSPAVLERVRVGRHPGFDRVVFQFRSGTPAWSARYVPKVLHDGSGLPVRLRGRAFVHVVFRGTRIDRSSAGGPEIVRTPRFPTLRQLKEAGDFEAVVSFGLGLSRKAGFRAFRLAGPSRIVLDVAH